MAFVRLLLVLLLASPLLHAQTPNPAFQEEVGHLNVRRDHVEWPSPESVVAQLRSADDAVRLKALYLIGLTEQQAHQVVWAQTSPTKIIGQKVVAPDQIELTYVALGTGATQQAIVAVQASEGQMTYAAIGVPTSKDGWERIATFDCWCKYDVYSGRNVLSEFVQVHAAPNRSPESPQRYELVLRASGGGTGIYTQNEAHFRIFHGELRRVLSFVSDHRSCIPTSRECTVEKRWVTPTAIDGESGGVLVESRGRFSSQQTSSIEMLVKALENRHLENTICRAYKWNAQKFQYLPSGAAEPCRKR